jgi:hypothetical protein
MLHSRDSLGTFPCGYARTPEQKTCIVCSLLLSAEQTTAAPVILFSSASIDS